MPHRRHVYHKIEDLILVCSLFDGKLETHEAITLYKAVESLDDLGVDWDKDNRLLNIVCDFLLNKGFTYDECNDIAGWIRKNLIPTK